jgi:hypothetical protein
LLSNNFAFITFNRKDAVPPSKHDKLVRFHEVPAFWGPKPRAKRGAKLNGDDFNKKVKF